MTDGLDQLQLAIANLINANERMRVNLEGNAVLLTQALCLLTDGPTISDALFVLPGSGPREASESATKNLLDAREELRSAIVNAALGTGIPLALLAERLEVTVEQVSAFAEGSARDSERLGIGGPRPRGI